MGVPQLADLVLETVNAPGTGAFTLGGAPDGRQTFADAFPSGGDVFYYAADGVQSEWGIGTLTVGSPNVLVRKTVIGNLFGTTAALNFTANVTVYSEVPAKNTSFLDEGGQLPVSSTPDFNRDVALSARVADGRYLQLIGNNAQTVSATVRFSGTVGFSGDVTFEGESTHNGVGTFNGALNSNYIVNLTADKEGDTCLFVTGAYLVNFGQATIWVRDATDFGSTQPINARTAEARYAKLNVDVPIGVPQLWPLETPPSGWLALNGASFDKTQYPGLAAVYTSGVLPDMRGKFVRGWDNGAGIDPNDGQTAPGNARALLSTQTDALQNITGTFANGTRGIVSGTSGAFSNPASMGWIKFSDWGGVGSSPKYDGAYFDASLVARTSTETRPTNMAWNMIVRAA